MPGQLMQAFCLISVLALCPTQPVSTPRITLDPPAPTVDSASGEALAVPARPGMPPAPYHVWFVLCPHKSLRFIFDQIVSFSFFGLRKTKAHLFMEIAVVDGTQQNP